MDEADRWIYLNGPEPAHVRPLLDVLRRAPPATAEDDAQFEQEFFARLDAQTAPSEDEEDEASAATTKPRAAPSVAGPATEVGATARSPVLDDHGHPPPVVAPPPPEPAAEAPARTGVPRPPERLAGTAPLPPGVREPKAALPFLAPEQVPAGKKSARTVPVPVMKRRGVAATVPAGDDAITRAVAALPFAGSAAAAAVFPRLTVNEYASFCAELAVAPESAGALLVKYQVGSKAAQEALDAHWRTRFGEDAGLRAAFERAFGEFVGWLRARRG